MSEVSDDTLRSAKVSGHRIKLARGSEVFVGYTDSGDSTVLEFTNNQGTKTVVGLSEEATTALADLLRRPRITAAYHTAAYHMVVDFITKSLPSPPPPSGEGGK